MNSRTGYPAKAADDESSRGAFRVSAAGRVALLAAARSSIARAIRAADAAAPAPGPRDAELERQGACFVTLTRSGRLRGCIGCTEADRPLVETVNEMAVAAATRDPRFPPVSAAELEEIRIEISVLSPLVRVASASAIRPGVHGVTIRSGSRRGLFLPQVWEHLPLIEDFLGELCSQKAGLPRDAWRSNDVDLFVFTVDAFEEP